MSKIIKRETFFRTILLQGKPFILKPLISTEEYDHSWPTSVSLQEQTTTQSLHPEIVRNFLLTEIRKDRVSNKILGKTKTFVY